MRRRDVFVRDNYRCVYCGSVFAPDELTVDHVQARTRQGDHSGGNLVTACRACNTRKGSRRLGEFLMEDATARANFFQYAVNVWPRHIRTLREEMKNARR